MSYAGDLTQAEFDTLLDRKGGPAVVVHGGAGTRPDVDPSPYFEGTRRATEAGLRVLLQGGSALDARAAELAMTLIREQLASGSGLTDTDRQVLDLVGQGMTDQQIAQWLKVPAATATASVRAMLRKLGLSVGGVAAGGRLAGA